MLNPRASLGVVIFGAGWASTNTGAKAAASRKSESRNGSFMRLSLLLLPRRVQRSRATDCAPPAAFRCSHAFVVGFEPVVVRMVDVGSGEGIGKGRAQVAPLAVAGAVKRGNWLAVVEAGVFPGDGGHLPLPQAIALGQIPVAQFV